MFYLVIKLTFLIFLLNKYCTMENSIKPDDYSFSSINERLIARISQNDYNKLEEILRHSYKAIELNHIKNDICYLNIMGFHLASITLTNHLLEKFVKTALVYNDISIKSVKDKSEYKPFELTDEVAAGNEKYDTLVLGKTIVLLFERGLITEKEKNILWSYKNDFRNPYSHSTKKDTYKGAQVKATEMYGDDAIKFINDLVSGKTFEEAEKDLPKQNINLENLPFADFKFAKDFAEKYSVPYLIGLHKIMISVESKIFKDKKNDK